MTFSKGLTLAALLAALAPGLLQAAENSQTGSVKLVPVGQQPDPGIPRPHNGQSQQAVIERFGEPVKKHAPVGDPPISRWEYPQFDVYFEYDKVIHAVLKTR
jgi:hypothetical protein